MIKGIRNFVKKHTRSLRAGMLAAIIFALILGVGFAFVSRWAINHWVKTNYNSEEQKVERYEEYIDDLQTFVSENKLSSEDTGKITRWVHGNRNVYLFLYKDNQLFFDSSIEQDSDKKNESAEGAGANQSGTADPDKESGGAGEGNESLIPGGGFTVDYPTREEIIESAEKNGLRQLELSDGTLFVKLADFSDYTYYSIANLTSIVGCVLIIVIVLMLYFQRIIFKISRLAKDVSAVYEVDMNTPIHYDDKNDEISSLSRNVEQMRSSMIDSLEKEKEAINANTELITSMSHDIRTPLTVLLGYLDIMKNSTDDETMQDYIKASEVTAMRLKNLSDDMFGYFLVFGNRDASVNVMDYDARTLIEQLFTEHVLLLTEKGYSVHMEIDQSIKEDIRVLTDAPKTMRVVDNLFSNIHKYADPSREITVLAAVSHEKLVCTVKNYVLENSDAKESNKIGLKTCEKICESLNMGFEYQLAGSKGQKTFNVRIEFPMMHYDAEV